MNECSGHCAAMSAAAELSEMLTAVLTPTEIRLFLGEAYHVCNALIEACQRQAPRNLIRWQPSMN